MRGFLILLIHVAKIMCDFRWLDRGNQVRLEYGLVILLQPDRETPLGWRIA